MRLIKIILIAICIHKSCTRGAGTLKTPGSVKTCKSGKPDYHSIASTAATVAERSYGVVSLLRTIPGVGGLFGGINLFLTAFKEDETDWEACIMNQVSTMIKNVKADELMTNVNGHNGVLGQVLTKLERYKSHAIDVENSWWQTANEQKVTEQKQKTIWDIVQNQEQHMFTYMNKFNTMDHEYNAGYYFVLPYYAQLHFKFMCLKIELAEQFDKLAFTKEEKKIHKRNLGKIILYYSEAALKFWRKARDNWCKGEAEAGGCDCNCRPPPFKTYIGEWGELAKSYGQTNVQNKITKWFESNTIRTGDEVAFKAVEAVDSSSRGYEYKDFYGYGLTGWLSCGGHTDWCYLRDCPGEYISGTSHCSAERFIIEKEAGPTGVDIINGDRLFLNAEHGWHSDHTYYLSLSTCWKYLADNSQLFCTEPWWASAIGGNKKRAGSPQAHFIRKKGNEDKTALENGDFVEIYSEKQYNGFQNRVMRIVFEIIKTWDGKSENGPITNMWKLEPADVDLEK